MKNKKCCGNCTGIIRDENSFARDYGCLKDGCSCHQTQGPEKHITKDSCCEKCVIWLGNSLDCSFYKCKCHQSQEPECKHEGIRAHAIDGPDYCLDCGKDIAEKDSVQCGVSGCSEGVHKPIEKESESIMPDSNKIYPPVTKKFDDLFLAKEPEICNKCGSKTCINYWKPIEKDPIGCNGHNSEARYPCYYCNKESVEEWEKDFDYRFVGNKGLDGSVPWIVKDYIKSLLSQAVDKEGEVFERGKEFGINEFKSRLLEKLPKREVKEIKYDESIPQEIYKLLYHEQTLRIGYNQAVVDVLKIIENNE